MSMVLFGNRSVRKAWNMIDISENRVLRSAALMTEKTLLPYFINFSQMGYEATELLIQKGHTNSVV